MDLLRKKMCQTSDFLSECIGGVGDRSSRYVFSKGFGSVVESQVVFLKGKREKII